MEAEENKNKEEIYMNELIGLIIGGFAGGFIGCVGSNFIYYKIKKRSFNKNHNYECDLYLKNILSQISERGILVKKMEKGDSFLFDNFHEYKRNLGAVPIKDKSGNICSVYVAYEDYDGSIKYYDYPQ